MAGQDAFAMVAFHVNLRKRIQIKSLNFQISTFPVPRSMIYIADAAAIKVCSFNVYLINIFRPFFAGDHNLWVQIS